MSGRKYDDQGRPLLLKDSKTASNNYGLNQIALNLAPRQKFLFYVGFVRSTGSGGYRTIGARDNLAEVASFAVKSIEQPRISINTETVNQYNKKRIVNTGSQFATTSLKFYDTSDDKAQRLWESYYQYYFSDPNKFSNKSWQYDQTYPQFNRNPGASGGWGLKIGDSPNPAEQNYFSHISIYKIFGNRFTQYDLINPKIIAFDSDMLDHAGEGFPEVTVSLSYEGIVYHDHDKLITESNVNLPFVTGTVDSDFFESEDGAYLDTYFGSTGVNPFGTGLNPSNALFSASQILTGVVGTGLDTALNSVLLTGNTKNLGKDVRNSVLNSFGLFNFGGANGNTIASSLANPTPSSLRTLGSTFAGTFLGPNAGDVVAGRRASLASTILSGNGQVIGGGNANVFDQSRSYFSYPQTSNRVSTAFAGGLSNASSNTGLSPADLARDNGSGLFLAPEALGSINQDRSSGAQIGHIDSSTPWQNPDVSDQTISPWKNNPVTSRMFSAATGIGQSDVNTGGNNTNLFNSINSNNSTPVAPIIFDTDI